MHVAVLHLPESSSGVRTHVISALCTTLQNRLGHSSVCARKCGDGGVRGQQLVGTVNLVAVELRTTPAISYGSIPTHLHG